MSEAGFVAEEPAGGQEKVMAADWMVMPLARSAGRKSVTVEPSSTSGVLLRFWIFSQIVRKKKNRENEGYRTCLPPNLRVKPL